MRTFTIIWFGQLVSTIGSYMTEFALTLWAWKVTGSATALALVGFFSQLSRIPITVFAGLIVDQFNRKQLMILGDAIAAFSTVAIGLLYLTNSLQIWHIYAASLVNGGFGQIQGLAYRTSISLIIPQQHYTRANSMNSAVHYGSNILAPALAGGLYPIIGLPGIILIDLITFGCAIATLIWLHIPQPEQEKPDQPEPLFQQLTFGIRYIWQQQGLRLLLIITTLFWFAHDLGGAIQDPMILARRGGDPQVFASIGVAAGIGGVTGAIVLSSWGGPRRRIFGMLFGFIGAGIAKTVFGLGRIGKVWVSAQFCSSLNFPLLGSSENAIWMEKITPQMQGRVFAANALVLQGVSAIASLIAGPLADYILEPAMRANGYLNPLLGGILGSQAGAGMALLYVICSLSMLTVGIGGLMLPKLRNLQELA